MPFQLASRSAGARRGVRPVAALALRWSALAFLLLVAGTWGTGNLSTSLAQDDPFEDPAEFESEPAVAPPVAAPSASRDETDSSGNVYLRNLASAGFIGALIGLLSLVAVGFIIEHFVTIRRARLMPEDVLLDLEQMIQEGRIDEAIEYCDQPGADSLVANVVQAGLERFRGSEFGFADYKYAVEEAGEDESARLYRKTEVLGVIGAIAPMLGLLGTVAGMIAAFNTIAEQEGAARPDELAGAIGQALVTTFLGLTVAIPCTIFFSFFRNRIDSIVAEAGKRVERVLSPLGTKR